MIAETPSHGYELMKSIEERMGGGYSPSPGVIYPTLAWLEDMGFAVSEAEGGRKRYRITAEGAAFLAANKAALDALAARMGPGGAGRGRARSGDRGDARAEAGASGAVRGRAGRRGGGREDRRGHRRSGRRGGEGHAERRATETPTLTSTARVASPKAAGYAAQLCKHFAHKIPARFEGSDGEIAFPIGTCRLHAEGETLTLTVEGADAGAVARLQEVVALASPPLRLPRGAGGRLAARLRRRLRRPRGGRRRHGNATHYQYVRGRPGGLPRRPPAVRFAAMSRGGEGGGKRAMGGSVRIAAGSIVVGVVVLAIKYLAYAVTGSVALYSDALESFVNVATAVAALLAVRLAEQPPDQNHPYGHYKVEYFSAVLAGRADHRRRAPHPARGLGRGAGAADDRGAGARGSRSASSRGCSTPAGAGC